MSISNPSETELHWGSDMDVNPVGAVDYLSCVSTDSSRPLDTLNPQVTLENVRKFLDEVVQPLGYTAGFHLQAGIFNPPSVVIDRAQEMGLNVYAGDIAYLQNPITTLNGIIRHPNPLESAGYAAMQILPLWQLHKRSMTTLVNGTLPVGERKIIRACTEIIANGQFDGVVRHLRSLGDNIILALEINGAYHCPATYLDIIRNLADQGFPVGISFDTAGMATADSENSESIDLGSIRRWYEKVLHDRRLFELLCCIEINPISEDGERHADIRHIQKPIRGMIADWENSLSPHNVPHFVVETHPKQLDEFLRNPTAIRKILGTL